MAKKKAATVNKAQAVRDYLGKHPEATASVVIPALGKEGITVSSALVSNTRSRMKMAGKLPSLPEGNSSSEPIGQTTETAQPTPKKATKKRAVKQARPATTAAPNQTARGLSAEDLFEAKQLADQLGGIAEAREALNVLESLR